ncbi:MAG: 8-amino-7-oxononanoate synthase [Rhodospirillaceae bacterium]|jgi:8-amino-7-oxononanoate synthase|nr:8-amino-7-oxononanoate synthase [Rhodospirillaceae bacterium]
MYDFENKWRLCLNKLDINGQRRRLRSVEERVNRNLYLDGRQVLDFSSNDYLGLAQHPELISRSLDFTRKWGSGSGASRLICGNILPFIIIEEKLAHAKKAEAALVFASGFAANSSILKVLLDINVLGAKPLVYCDKLNHASLHQGCLCAGVSQIRFRHNDLDHLESLLIKDQKEKCPRFIITETIFSMDGDRVDLTGLQILAKRFGAFLYLDEAHATGVFGENGFGLANGFAGHNCLVMGTFSKALGSFGSYVVCTKVLRNYLINRCWGLIYSTALPPSVLGAIDAAIDLIPSMDSKRARLMMSAKKFRVSMINAGFDIGTSSTQIVPIILGSKTTKLANSLEENGLLGIAIHPPTVPSNSSRIRFTFSANHTDEQIDRLIATIIAEQ